MTDEIKEYLTTNKITMSAEFVPQSRSRNALNDDGTKYIKPSDAKLNWRITVIFGSRALPTFEYSQGIAHCISYTRCNSVYVNSACIEECETGRGRKYWVHKKEYSHISTKTPSPELADVLYCVLADASVLDAGGFDNWCSDYGYDDDSIKAKAIYDQCIEQALNLRAIVGDKMIEELRTLFQDY